MSNNPLVGASKSIERSIVSQYPALSLRDTEAYRDRLVCVYVYGSSVRQKVTEADIRSIVLATWPNAEISLMVGSSTGAGSLEVHVTLFKGMKRMPCEMATGLVLSALGMALLFL